MKPSVSFVFLFVVAAAIQLVCASNIRRYHWRVTQFPAAYDGVTRLVYGINNRPGHESPIEITLGDTIEVHVVNALQEPTCIHWHGMKQYGTPQYDGTSGITQCSIKPGRSMVYRFKPSEAGTFWWHGHDDTQYTEGLRGPLIVHDPKNHQSQSQSRPRVDEEYTVQMADWYHNGGLVWDTVLINDRGRFNCSELSEPVASLPCTDVQPLTRFKFQHGKRYLLRLINVAAHAAFEFSIDEHEFRVVAADGNPVQPSATINSLIINVAQRYEIIVDAHRPNKCGSDTDRFWMRATSLFNPPWTPPLNPPPSGFNPNGLAIVEYGNQQQYHLEPTSSPWDDAAKVTIPEFGFKPLQAPELVADPERHIVSFTMTTTEENPAFLAYISIDGSAQESFVMPPRPTLFEIASGLPTSKLPTSSNALAIKLGRQIEVVLINRSNSGQHPFHLHGHAVWVLGSGTMPSADSVPEGLNLVDPMLRDVYTVPPCPVNSSSGECDGVGFLVLRFNTDNPGVWMLHCHINQHLELGLAMLIVEGESELQRRGLRPFKQAITETCSGLY
ncbi:hypothetical protein Poli38472_014314 [Pythium oligandrum]|nr:hypothetical protein Poli38472_014312 [Pythium oligandrum]TMW57710.1 hypothetical protein Poli38472_014313 [Pythium oligandrum]TMW57711.1 hypothetical protein Poli38472_014314 [Pythium oligandrum]|eukprot:TMW57709.1 hypothetical protein Poli38472_014312 [Pythium oligandrum]